MRKSDSVAHLLTALSSRQQLEGLRHATGVARGTAEVLAWTDESRQPVQERATEAQDYSQTPPRPDRGGCLASASSPSLAERLLRIANSVFPDLPGMIPIRHREIFPVRAAPP